MIGENSKQNIAIIIVLLLKLTITFWNSKGQAVPPKHLFYAVTKIEQDQYVI